jgi:hypothetical protein
MIVKRRIEMNKPIFENEEEVKEFLKVMFKNEQPTKTYDQTLKLYFL